MGRKRSAEQWQRLIADYEASGLTQVEFARKHGVAESSIQRWRSRLGRGEGQVPACGVEFVQVKANDGEPAVQIALSEGVVIRFGQAAEASLIAEVAQHVARARC